VNNLVYLLNSRSVKKSFLASLVLDSINFSVKLDIKLSCLIFSSINSSSYSNTEFST